MLITIKRSGGYAGIQTDIPPVDTARMSAANAGEIERLVGDLDFFAMPATVATASTGADFMTCTVEIVDGGRRNTVTFTDDGSPDIARLSRLVGSVEQAAASIQP